MIYASLHICCLACVLLCCTRLSLTADDMLTALPNNSARIKMMCTDGKRLELSGIEWTTVMTVDADFEHMCDTEPTKQLFHKLCDKKTHCDLPINFRSECIAIASLSVHYFCDNMPHVAYLAAREASCPPCPTKDTRMVKTLELLLIVLVAILFVTNLIQIGCFLYIAQKKQPAPPIEQTAGHAAGLRLSVVTTARRLPADYADKLTTVPMHHFTSGVIAKRNYKKGKKVMGARMPQQGHHRFSLLVETPYAPSAEERLTLSERHTTELSPVSEDL